MENIEINNSSYISPGTGEAYEQFLVRVTDGKHCIANIYGSTYKEIIKEINKRKNLNKAIKDYIKYILIKSFGKYIKTEIEGDI